MVSRQESVEAIARYKVSYRKGMSSSNGKITDTTLITPTITDRSRTRCVLWMTNSCGNTANEAQISPQASHTLVHTSPLTMWRFCSKSVQAVVYDIRSHGGRVPESGEACWSLGFTGGAGRGG